MVCDVKKRVWENSGLRECLGLRKNKRRPEKDGVDCSSTGFLLTKLSC